jgi:hypothetical protein
MYGRSRDGITPDGHPPLSRWLSRRLPDRFGRGDSLSVLHYGLQRSGTNLLVSILESNYQVRILNRGDLDRRSPMHKHTRLYAEKHLIPEPQFANTTVIDRFEDFQAVLPETPDHFVVISKDPYSWYLSYKNWAEKCNWPPVEHHYISEYNAFYRFFSVMASESDRFLFVRYTDLLAQPMDFVENLGQKIGLAPNGTWPSRRRGNGGLPRRVPHSKAFGEEQRSYYLTERYLAKFADEDLQALNAELDPAVMSFLGYELETRE